MNDKSLLIFNQHTMDRIASLFKPAFSGLLQVKTCGRTNPLDPNTFELTFNNPNNTLFPVCNKTTFVMNLNKNLKWLQTNFHILYWIK